MSEPCLRAPKTNVRCNLPYGHQGECDFAALHSAEREVLEEVGKYIESRSSRGRGASVWALEQSYRRYRALLDTKEAK